MYVVFGVQYESTSQQKRRFVRLQMSVQFVRTTIKLYAFIFVYFICSLQHGNQTNRRRKGYGTMDTYHRVTLRLWNFYIPNYLCSTILKMFFNYSSDHLISLYTFLVIFAYSLHFRYLHNVCIFSC